MAFYACDPLLVSTNQMPASQSGSDAKGQETHQPLHGPMPTVTAARILPRPSFSRAQEFPGAGHPTSTAGVAQSCRPKNRGLLTVVFPTRFPVLFPLAFWLHLVDTSSP